MAAVSAGAGLQISPWYIPGTNYGSGNTNAVVLANTASNILGNTNAVQTLFDFSKTSDATIAVTAASGGAPPSTNTFTFAGSVDTVNWTSNVLTFTVTTLAGPNTNVTVITNLIAGQRYPFYSLTVVSNTGATGVASNIIVKAYSKNGF